MKRLPIPACLLLCLSACGGATEPDETEQYRVVVEPGSGLMVGVGERLSLRATVFDGSGSVVGGQDVAWSSSDASVADVDGTGAVTSVAPGLVTVTARAAGATGTASVEVYVPPVVDAYVSGETYLGRNGYTEYFAGDLPVIIGAPHGGDMEPEEIPDRTYGVTAADRNTRELSMALAAAIEARTGGRPHVIINRLHRVKHDANRDIGEAAQESPFAEQAWREFHGFIEDARGLVTEEHGSGLYIDMHGHAHEIQRLELGYLLSGSTLAVPDDQLDALASQSSLWALAQHVEISFSQLLRGPDSFGSLLANRGYRAVPSSAEPDPGGNPFFSGGFNTRVHGSRSSGTVSAIQIEHQYEGVRDTETSRGTYAGVLALVIDLYLAEHFGLDLGGG